MSTRHIEYKKYWQSLTDYYGKHCFYCQKEIATCIDHVVPYSYDEDNSIENLVPACMLCNTIAGNKHFESVEHKRQYILDRRKSRVNRTAICADCLLPFEYRFHSPSLLLCAECYDLEYDTAYSSKKKWGTWIASLQDAGIPIEAHRKVKEAVQTGRLRNSNRKEKIKLLLEWYTKLIETDERLAKALIYS